LEAGYLEAGISLNQHATLLRCRRKTTQDVSLTHCGNASAWRGPDFLILGAQKTATSSLYQALNAHPCVLPALDKELLFFSEPTIERYGRLYYRSCFPDTHGSRYVTGEASATYFSNLPVLDRMLSVCREARFIVSVRDPASRAISDYHMKVRDGREGRPMDKAFQNEIELLKQEGALPPLLMENHYLCIDTRYILKGMYYHAFGRLLERVPRERILLIDAGELRNDPAGVMDSIHTFLGIRLQDRAAVTHPVEENVGQYDRQSTQAMRRLLAEFYRPYNERFFALAGRSFDW
jgi:Sulfotransferase domain